MVDNKTIWQELGVICFETLNKWAKLDIKTISYETKINLERLEELADYDSALYGAYDKREINELHSLWYRTYNSTFDDETPLDDTDISSAEWEQEKPKIVEWIREQIAKHETEKH